MWTLCHWVPLLVKGEVSPCPSSPWKYPVVGAGGQSKVFPTRMRSHGAPEETYSFLLLLFVSLLRFVSGIPRANGGSSHFVGNTKVGSRAAIQQDGERGQPDPPKV